jgi:hypothetical protein
MRISVILGAQDDGTKQFGVQDRALIVRSELSVVAQASAKRFSDELK